MEKIDKDKTLSYLDGINDVDTLKEFQSQLDTYKTGIRAEIEDQVQELTEESLATSTPFTYIAYKLKSLEKKISNLLVLKENVTEDLSQIGIAITSKINGLSKK